MKNILKITLIFVVSLMLTNCEDNEKSPIVNAPNGGFVLVDLEDLVIDVTNLETSTYGGILRSTSDVVSSHEFQVRRVSDGNASDYATVFTTDNFPSEFRISASDIANALGLDVTDLLPGDRFDFVGKTITTDGTIVTKANLNADLQAEAGQRQAYELVTYISCPFKAEEAIGTYLITHDPFDASILSDIGQQDTFEVVAGPGANQVTFIDVFGHARFGNLPTPGNFDIVVDIDPVTGIATVNKEFDGNKQFAWDSANYGLPFGLIFLEDGDGFLFSCSGQFTISWRHTLLDGRTYGFRSFAAQKQ